jgi:hypothetical protein
MSRFAEIEKSELEEHRTKVKMDRVLKCEYRKHAGFYNVKCFHPERAKDRQCVDTDCPVV